MNTKYTVLALALGVSSVAMAQEVDDMYFNSRDRLALSESNQATLAIRNKENDRQAVNSNPVNPSDTYTGRGVNPEYNAQQKNGTTLENPDYFLSSYQPKDINSNLYSGNSSNYSSCNCGNAGPYSGAGYSGFGNPYGSSYSPYGNYYSPYSGFSPGLTTSIGYGFGSCGSMYSMGMNYGMGNMYGYPSYGMYNPYGYSNYGYPTNTVVVTGADIGQAYGRRPSRSSSLNNYVDNSGVIAGTNGRGRETGQARTLQTNYYDPSWRSDPSNFPSRSYDNGGRSSYPVSGSSSRSWTGDSGRTRSAFDSFGSGSRGSAGSPGGGSSPASSGGGHSRGRN